MKIYTLSIYDDNKIINIYVGVPFQAFRWKAGAQGRYKETIISMLVAKERNICQGCLKDMKYDLPAGVRDALLRDTSASNGQVCIETYSYYWYIYNLVTMIHLEKMQCMKNYFTIHNPWPFESPLTLYSACPSAMNIKCQNMIDTCGALTLLC
jgi:hypothetical protein